MRQRVIRLLLAILNSRWLNQSPCQYGYVNNLDAFSYENLRSEDKQQPGITVREILDSADMFKACPIGRHGDLMVIENGEVREGTMWDVHELRQALTPPNKEIQ